LSLLDTGTATELWFSIIVSFKSVW
jgi:hypothetical protein